MDKNIRNMSPSEQLAYADEVMDAAYPTITGRLKGTLISTMAIFMSSVTGTLLSLLSGALAPSVAASKAPSVMSKIAVGVAKVADKFPMAFKGSAAKVLARYVEKVPSNAARSLPSELGEKGLMAWMRHTSQNIATKIVAGAKHLPLPKAEKLDQMNFVLWFLLGYAEDAAVSIDELRLSDVGGKFQNLGLEKDLPILRREVRASKLTLTVLQDNASLLDKWANGLIDAQQDDDLTALHQIDDGSRTPLVLNVKTLAGVHLYLDAARRAVRREIRGQENMHLLQADIAIALLLAWLDCEGKSDAIFYDDAIAYQDANGVRIVGVPRQVAFTLNTLIQEASPLIEYFERNGVLDSEALQSGVGWALVYSSDAFISLMSTAVGSRVKLLQALERKGTKIVLKALTRTSFSLHDILN